MVDVGTAVGLGGEDDDPPHPASRTSGSRNRTFRMSGISPGIQSRRSSPTEEERLAGMKLT
jgi:hypothetical protein